MTESHEAPSPDHQPEDAAGNLVAEFQARRERLDQH